jgi:hypothetical protein
MRKRLWWIIPLVAVLLIFGGMTPLLAPRPSPVTKAAFERIETGMTKAEVENILGGPLGDYTTRPRSTARSSAVTCIGWAARDAEEWDGDEVTIWVVFESMDNTGESVVAFKDFREVEPMEVGMVETLLWRFDRWRAGVFGAGSAAPIVPASFQSRPPTA